jgi:hypothetical protein
MVDVSEPIDLSFLLEPDVQFENRVRPTDEALERFKMIDANHRTVTADAIWKVFWSDEFQADRPSMRAPAFRS